MFKKRSLLLSLVASVLLFAGILVATQPTVTLTETSRGAGDLRTFEFSFASAIATADSAFIYQNISNSTPFGVESMFDKDSVATLTLRSSEATADSVRYTVLIQGTSVLSPVDADYLTIVTDATSFTNATTAIINFRLKELVQTRKLRVILFENDTSKDATQTITGTLNIPK